MPGGWTGSDRRERLPADWAAWVRRVRARSGGTCEVVKGSTGKRCTNQANGGVDHIDRELGESMANLRDTCHFHHAAKTTREGQQAKAEKKVQRRRPDEEHPGLIRR